MRKWFGVVLFFLCSSAYGASVSVRTPGELEAAIAKDNPAWTEILLDSPAFVHTKSANLDIRYSSTASPLVIAIAPEQTGDVVIRPAVGRRVSIWANNDGRGCDVTIRGRKNADGSIQRIQFDESSAVNSATVEVASWYVGTGTTKARFDYVDFCNNTSGNGFRVASNPVEDIDITCNYCRAYNNKHDGWSLPGQSSYQKYITLRLNYCEAYNQDPKRLAGPGAGDGVTNHTDYARVLINGGVYRDNGKAGVAHVAGYLQIVGAMFYGNGAGIQSNGDVYIGLTPSETKCYALIDRCVFSELDDVNTGCSHIRIQHVDYVEISNCIFYSQKFGNTGTAIKSDCQAINLVIRDNTFYDQYRGIYYRDALVFNNIFNEIITKAIDSEKDDYHLMMDNGYNCFYNVGVNNILRDTDVNGDPRFVDPGSGDFRLRGDSSCLNAGKPTLDGGFSDIGAWQGRSVFRDLPANCSEALKMDLNDDCKVDSQDLAILCARWLECRLEPAELCWE